MKRQLFIILGLALIVLAIIFRVFLTNPTMMRGFWVSTPLVLASIIFFVVSLDDKDPGNVKIDSALAAASFAFAAITGAPSYSYWF